MTRFASHELERALQNGTRVAEGLFPLGVIDHHYVKYLPHLAHRTQPAKDYSFIHSQTQHAIRRRRKLTSTVSKQKQKQKCPLPDIHATRPHTERNLTATTTTMLQRRLLKKIEKRKKKKKPRARMFLSHCLKNGLLKGAAFRFGLVCLIHSLTSLFIFFHDTISLSLSLSLFRNPKLNSTSCFPKWRIWPRAIREFPQPRFLFFIWNHSGKAMMGSTLPSYFNYTSINTMIPRWFYQSPII